MQVLSQAITQGTVTSASLLNSTAQTYNYLAALQLGSADLSDPNLSIVICPQISLEPGIWRALEMIQRSRQKKANDKTADVVTDKVRDCAIEPLRNDVHELSMTVNRLHEGVQQMRVDADTKHSENLTAIAKLMSDSDENKRLHAEHISVTNSLTSGVERLNEAVGQVVPGFVGVDILKRQKPT